MFTHFQNPDFLDTHTAVINIDYCRIGNVTKIKDIGIIFIIVSRHSYIGLVWFVLALGSILGSLPHDRDCLVSSDKPLRASPADETV